MSNRVKETTDDILDKTLDILEHIYNAGWLELHNEIEPIIDEMCLDNHDVTPTEHTRHADKTRKDTLVKLFVSAVVVANLKAIKHINTSLESVYKINAEDVSNYIFQKSGIDIISKGVDIKELISKYTRRSYDASLDKVHISRDILREIEKMLRAGEGTKKISQRLQRLYSMEKTSADRITITETTRIQSRGRWDVMVEATKRGMKFKKIWRHQLYVRRPRDWHVNMNGQQSDLDKPFYTKYGNQLMYPGDPRAPAREVCNCRCWLDEVLISF